MRYLISVVLALMLVVAFSGEVIAQIEEAKVKLGFVAPNQLASGQRLEEAAVRDIMYLVEYRPEGDPDVLVQVYDGKAHISPLAWDPSMSEIPPEATITVTLPAGNPLEIIICPHLEGQEVALCYKPLVMTPERKISGPVPVGNVEGQSVFVD